MDLSIIIVNWKVKKLLNRCLNSIFSCLTGQDFEVIVVDNASGDGSEEMVKENFPQVKLIVNKSNLGFAKGCNQGIRIARGRYLFLLNPDTQLTNNIQEKIIGFMESHPEVGVGGCYLYYPDGRGQTSFYKFTSLTNHSGRAFLLYSFLPKNSLTAPFFSDFLRDNQSIDRVTGGAMVVRRQAFEEVGLFDESYFLYYEDEDLCYRMRQGGWKIASIPETKVIHHHNKSGEKNIRSTIFSSYRSQLLFFRKFNPFYKVLVFRAIQSAAVSIRCPYWFFRFLANPDQREFSEKSLAYLRILLSNFYFSKSLIKQ